jgi:hypothetical protein
MRNIYKLLRYILLFFGLKNSGKEFSGFDQRKSILDILKMSKNQKGPTSHPKTLSKNDL